MAQWSIGVPTETARPDGGLVATFDALLDGVVQGSVTSEMTGDGAWTVTWAEAFPGAVKPRDFRAWIKGAST